MQAASDQDGLKLAPAAKKTLKGRNPAWQDKEAIKADQVKQRQGTKRTA